MSPEVDVRGYSAKETWGSIDYKYEIFGVWTKSYDDGLYPMSNANNGWEESSQVGCYMERSASSWQGAFNLKNSVAFRGTFGYSMYNEGTYDIKSNNYFDSIRGGWDRIDAVYSAETFLDIDVTWWNIESASSLVAGVVAVWTLFI